MVLAKLYVLNFHDKIKITRKLHEFIKHEINKPFVSDIGLHDDIKKQRF